MSDEEGKESGGKKVVLLVSSMSASAAVVTQQNRARMMLSACKVKFEELECTDAANRDRRNHYWGISGKRAVYPQLFIDEEFIGDYDMLDDLNEAGTLKEKLAGADEVDND